MATGESARSFGDLLSKFGARRPAEKIGVAPGANGGVEQEPTYGTKALRKFFSLLHTRSAPVLLDLGPVVGTNVTYFGERFGCKILIEDLYADLERHYRQGQTTAFPEFVRRRFAHPDGSVDAIICWDVIDYLDRASARVLAEELTRILRVDGALLGFFGTVPAPDSRFTKYVIVDDLNLRHRPCPAVRGRQQVLQNRDILKLFDGLRVSDSFLLQTNLREILFRKPAYLGATRATI